MHIEAAMLENFMKAHAELEDARQAMNHKHSPRMERLIRAEIGFRKESEELAKRVAGG